MPTLRVYPRACGGTSQGNVKPLICAGLSPRVRGNLEGPLLYAIAGRSIPARAGEPHIPPSGKGLAAVYPRACGGTRFAGHTWAAVSGLSPRVRGNLRSVWATNDRWGSIPARAGEPKTDTLAKTRATVYPRACGGTCAAGPGTPRPAGLSPRVRGNPGRPPLAFLQRRSIPARAGEPSQGPRLPRNMRVYPRACGGTPESSKTTSPTSGLSPRVRGNLCIRTRSSRFFRSIPARAGEPV